jgi:hypothetical protein
MRALRLLLVTALSCGALLVLAPAAGAASSTVKTCKTLRQLDQDLSDVNLDSEDNFDQDGFADIGDAFHDASKRTKGSLKPALDSIGDVYEDLGDSDNYIDAITTFAKHGQKWTKALGTYTKFLTTKCV